jgi:hypothetical protein
VNLGNGCLSVTFSNLECKHVSRGIGLENTFETMSCQCCLIPVWQIFSRGNIPVHIPLVLASRWMVEARNKGRRRIRGMFMAFENEIEQLYQDLNFY